MQSYCLLRKKAKDTQIFCKKCQKEHLLLHYRSIRKVATVWQAEPKTMNICQMAW